MKLIPPDENPEVEQASEHDHHASYAADKAKILARLRRMEGQVRGVQRMIEEDKYCVDVLTQISSIIAASRAVGMLVLEDHIRGCVVNADEKDTEVVLTELTDAIERFSRSVG
ncbi:MAG: metal-sensitive transcriptional regulator [Thermomicrobiales bacterium]|nr:metal-sensitive transcriptional regulator [Thermomicrobiales bacterium]